MKLELFAEKLGCCGAAQHGEAAMNSRIGCAGSDTYAAAQKAENAMLHRLLNRAPSLADIASAAECAAAGRHLTATDVTGRTCCVVCGVMG